MHAPVPCVFFHGIVTQRGSAGHLREHYDAILIERRFDKPAVAALSSSARTGLF